MSREEREALRRRLRTGPMYESWHWLAFNFAPEPPGETPFARITLDALLRCDAVMPGYADAMLTTLESIGGRDHDMDDYESIRQWLGELVVVHHFVIAVNGWNRRLGTGATGRRRIRRTGS